MNLTVLFDGSFDGFLSIIHAHYYDKLMPDVIYQMDCVQESLYSDYFTVKTDYEKSKQVFLGIIKKISQSVLDTVYHAFLAEDRDNYMAIYKYICFGFKVGKSLENYLQLDFVHTTHAMARKVSREAHLLKGFCRFARTMGDVFYCHITPKAFVLPILAEHFRDRLHDQKWLIVDKKRNIAAIYNLKNLELCEISNLHFVYDTDEEYFQSLWKVFFKTIGIEQRRNYKLQRNLLPIRYRENMTEFNSNLYKDLTFEMPLDPAEDKKPKNLIQA